MRYAINVLVDWLSRIVYFPMLALHAYWFFKGYLWIFTTSHDRLEMVVQDRFHFHLALIIAFVVAWWIGVPRPSAWYHLQTSPSAWVAIFRVFVGLHSARIALFLAWLGTGYVFLRFTDVPDPAAAGVAGATIFFLLMVLLFDQARRLQYPGHYVETNDLPRSGPALTLFQAADQLSRILASAGLRR